MRTHGNPICRGSPLRHRDHRGGLSFFETHDFDFILRVLRVWVPKRIIPRLGALSVVRILAKQSQTRASWGIWGTGRRRDEHRANAPNKPNLPGGAGGAGRGMLYKQSQFPPDQKEGQVLGGKGVMVNTTFDKPQQNKANSPIADCGLPERPGNWHPPGGVGLGTDLPPPTRAGDCAKQTQFGPAWAEPGPGWAKDTKQSQLPEIEPKRWMWNPPPYAGHTRSGTRDSFCLNPHCSRGYNPL